MADLAKITIKVPPGCDRTSLSFDALDSVSRDLARRTFIWVDGKQLLCRSFATKTRPDGSQVVMLEVMQECVEIVQSEA